MAMRQANKRVAAPFQQRPVKLQHDYGPGPVAMSEKARNSHNHNNYQGKSDHLDQPSKESLQHQASPFVHAAR
jgi:hypothetical protein